VDPERLNAWEREHASVLRALADPDVVSDRTRLEEASRREKDLDALISVARQLHDAQEDVVTARQMLTEASGDDRELVRAELESAQSEVEKLEEQLRVLLVPRDPNDGRNVIVEIRGAEGGEEANLFARDLFEMYRHYAERRGWRMELLSSNPSERDGFNEVTFLVKGAEAWQRMKHEGGTHRVQRVPVTESQ
jgi:peptide chain release factor 1